MRKFEKLSVLILVVIFITIFLNTSTILAANGMPSVFDRVKNQTNGSLDSEVETNVFNPIKQTGQAAITIVQVVGTGIAIIMLIVLAMKYMLAAPGDKAEVKKHAVVYIVGAVVLFGAAGIWDIIETFATNNIKE